MRTQLRKLHEQHSRPFVLSRPRFTTQLPLEMMAAYRKLIKNKILNSLVTLKGKSRGEPSPFVYFTWSLNPHWVVIEYFDYLLLIDSGPLH